MSKRLVFTVTNDLVFDQRMNRICSSLKNAEYEVLLIGRKSSKPLLPKNFSQKRLHCLFQKGFFFYAEYNIRLFFYLLFLKFDLICSIDLDTIIPGYLVSSFRKKERVYDAHELFCGMKEVVNRPAIYRVWKFIEKKSVPRFKNGYTVNTYIKNILQKDYGVHYEVIRNMSVLKPDLKLSSSENFIIYQGAVNHGRSFETLIPAFQWINTPLYIYGQGNFVNEARQLIEQYQLQNKVFLKGAIEPDKLRIITPMALFGITIFENEGLSNFYSLANRFFDYMHAGIPQVCVDYPAYREINDEFEVAVLVKDLSQESLAKAINELLKNQALQKKLRENCWKAREVLNWQGEEKKLLEFYERIFSIMS